MEKKAVFCFIFIILFFSLVISTRGIAYCQTYSKNDLVLHLMSGNKDVIIRHAYDLDGDTILLPKGKALIFKEAGLLTNGLLRGDDNVIISHNNEHIFENVSFGGKFSGSIDSKWFELLYGKPVDNSKELNNALLLAHLSTSKVLKLEYNKVLYVKSDQNSNKTRDFLRSGSVEIKSNVIFDLNHCTIKCLPNSSKCYNIIFSRLSDNITIKNGLICGDTKSHYGTGGEWGYGIELQGVHDFLIENIEVKECWGDGINIQVAFDGDGNLNSNKTQKGHCINGVIKNVNSHHNRRQGMSIEGVIRLKVLNCKFSYIDGANPRSGIDIEPYTAKNIVYGVHIEGCEFYQNAYSGILMMGENVNDVLIKKCKFSNNKVFDLTLKGNNIKIYNCDSISLRLVDNCRSVEVNGTNIDSFACEDFIKSNNKKDISFYNCVIPIYVRDYKFSRDKCLVNIQNCKYK